ncbi:hypothetical protein SAMN05444420_10721 [Capnocytophaga granulosa]|jgi:hypothetical protein|uniref:Uncharacterized protein n=1 Tax=Capnocytophaga granulosa TaxID=45242 RepID=A0A1H2YEW6_9FLAO|nr:hypothetical protein [Capnocytophaga granulosa]EPD27473.1 hypothetical protein HMPREF9331_02230 [Capnocytophaga granulosa ATCC 51502]SDX03752.1 hypothetical protein SAMN05444420_10721 [Capnocytophaga granulosa]SUX18302.1 Uncharacterised protein [Capnocytophaga granulosa]
MGNKAFGAGKNQGIKIGLEMGKKALENEKVKTAVTGGVAAVLGLIGGAIIKALSSK